MFEFVAIGTGSKVDNEFNGTSSQARILIFDKNVTILADPGWNGIDSLEFYDKYISSIDMVLLSQTTASYIGAYALLVDKYPKLASIPTFSTLPISKLGRITTLELYRSIGIVGPIEGNYIESNQILKIFNNIKCLNYSQTIHLSHVNNKLINISLTAYNSGYSIGGCIWLVENNINERILYAPIWNHSKDEFLNNCKIFNNPDLMRPTTFITNTEFVSSKLTHQNKIDKFINLVENNIISGTSVLLPTTLTGRFFELLIPILLRIKFDVSIYLLNFTGLENLKILSNFLEWMNQNITKLWENEKQSTTIFENNKIQLIKFEELNDLMSSSEFMKKPKVFFLEEMNMIDGSFFNQFLIEFNSKINYTMILTEEPKIDSNLYKFFNIWHQHVNSTNSDSKDGSLIILEMPDFKFNSIKEEMIRGKELSTYLKKIADKRESDARLEKEELERKKLEEMMDADIKVETDSEDDDNDNDNEEDNKKIYPITNNNNSSNNNNNNNNNNDKSNNTEIIETGNKQQQAVSTASTEISIIKAVELEFQMDESKTWKLDEILSLPRDFDVSNLKHKNRVFPFMNPRANVDDYGIIIKHEDFQIYEDDRFPIIGNTTDMNSDNKDDSDVDSDSNDNDNQNYFNGRKRNKNDNNKRSNKNKKFSRDKDSIISNNKKITVYSLDSTVDPVIRNKTATKISIRCGFSFIDLSGNHDLRSLKFTTKQIKPRKVIILPGIGGGNKESDELMLELHKDTQESILNGDSNVVNTDIEYIRSKINEPIDLGNVITSYEIQIDEKLASSLKWQELNDGYSVSYVSGIVEKIKEWEYKLTSGDNNNRIMDIGRQNIKIGDIKLTQLRKVLSQQAHHVELMGDGRLVVDDELIVSKVSDGNIVVEGGVGELFYKVKSVIENMLATI